MEPSPVHGQERFLDCLWPSTSSSGIDLMPVLIFNMSKLSIHTFLRRTHCCKLKDCAIETVEILGQRHWHVCLRLSPFYHFSRMRAQMVRATLNHLRSSLQCSSIAWWHCLWPTLNLPEMTQRQTVMDACCLPLLMPFRPVPQ